MFDVKKKTKQKHTKKRNTTKKVNTKAIILVKLFVEKYINGTQLS